MPTGTPAPKEAGVTERVSTLLRNRAEIKRARVFLYHLMAAYRNCDESVPSVIPGLKRPQFARFCS
jgi:hypothetical protein